SARDSDLWIVGGGNVASQFADAGLLDEVAVTIVPVVLGGGGRCSTAACPAARCSSGASSPGQTGWSSCATRSRAERGGRQEASEGGGRSDVRCDGLALTVDLHFGQTSEELLDAHGFAKQIQLFRRDAEVALHRPGLDEAPVGQRTRDLAAP